MDTQDLLEILKAEARQIACSHRSDLERLRAAAGGGEGVASAVAAYDYRAFTLLLDAGRAEPVLPVNEADLAAFRRRVDRYMDAHAQGNEGFKAYIGVVSAYLAFVARMPLHPPGMRFSGDRTIVFAGGAWLCPGKSEYIRDPASPCKYCVCRGV